MAGKACRQETNTSCRQRLSEEFIEIKEMGKGRENRR